MKTMLIGSPFLGINNRLPDFALHVPKVGDWLRSGVNVEVTNAGTIVRRKVATLLQAMTGAHSLTSGYYVRDSSIYTLVGEFTKLLSNNTSVSWCKSGDDLFYSNGVDSGRITAGVVYPLALPTPAQPTHTIIGGGLEPGWYQVATSYGRYDGTTLLEEGGLSASGNHELTTLGGLRIPLPGPVTGATHVHIYLSKANGEVPYLLATAPVGTATYDCISLPTGRECTGRYEAPLPAGQLFMSNNRLCSIVGNTVYVGLPFRPGYYLPAEGYIPFPSPVTLAVENQGGTYVCAGRTYFFPGDFGNMEGTVRDVLPYGAVPGTAFKHPTEPVVGWFGAKGFVLADTQGQAKCVTEDAVDVVAPASGVAAVFETEGYRRVVSCGYCMNLENKAVTTYTGWDFNSVSEGYGAKSDGIYLLNSVGLVPWSVGLGKQNFGAENLKLMPAAYAGVASSTKTTLTVGYVDERGDAQAYDFDTRDCSEMLQVQRFDTAKGMRSNWFDLTLSNADGSDFTLASVSFAPTASTRRI